MQDNELFELCDKVWNVIGLEDNDHDVMLYAIGKKGEIWDKDAAWLYSKKYAPLYTSDYLLEKLGDYVELKHFGKGYGVTKYVDDQIINSWSDTPLKALLKLTLALHKAGEL